MTLCDLSRLPRFTAEDAGALSARLTLAGVTREALHPITKLCERLPEPFRNPTRRYHLRRLEAPLGPLLRAFFFGDPVPSGELRDALGGELSDRLLDVGLLLALEAGVVCPLRLNLVHDLWIFTDDLTLGEEAVMGAGATTATLIQTAWPAERVGSVLDMGCGAGTAALLMARTAGRALGVDISERALALCRLNALMAGAQNVDFAQSDLFSAVQGQKFDLIVSQPPFVACPADTASVTFLHGGARGDELALELLGRLPDYLEPGGRAVLLVDWPHYDDVPIGQRIRQVVGERVPLDLLVLLGAPKDLDEHVTFYGITLAQSLGERFEDYVLTHRHHLERMHIDALRLVFIVLRRTTLVPWTRVLEMRPLIEVDPTGAHIDRLLAVQDLLRSGTEALLDAELAVPPDTRFVEQDAKSVRVELPPSRLVAPVVTSRAGADLVIEVGRTATVRDAVEATFERFPQLRAGGPERVLAGVRAALESGLLELRDDGQAADMG